MSFRSLVSLFALLFATALVAQEGAITGTVTDKNFGAALPGALVSVQGTRVFAQTDSTGTYRITGVPAGSRTVDITFLGFRSERFDIDVVAGSTVAHDVVLTIDRLSDAITVSADPLLEGQAKALNQQKNAMNVKSIVAADQIGKFPDSNSAEATQRIPGVSVERDQGEGRYVLIRGTESRLNSMMLNGDRIPSPEGEIRAVALDVVPADVLQSIEVSKTLTPDMDADAIGGVVNLVTKSAGARPITTVSLGAGWNDISEDTLRNASATLGRRINDRVGFLAGVSWFETDRGSENFEAAWDDDALDELETRHYSVGRKRVGALLNADLQVSDATALWVRGSFNQFDDQEFRRRVRYRISDTRIERQLKDRFESQKIMNASIGGTSLFDGRFEFDYRGAWLYAEEDEPRAWETTFVQKKIGFAPSDSNPSNLQPNPSGEDISKFVLDEIAQDDNHVDENDLVFAANLSMPFSMTPENGGRVKFGTKFRGKNKTRNQTTTVFSPEDDIFLSSLADRSFGTHMVLGRYDSGTHVSPSLARELTRSGQLESELDPEADLGDFDANEDIYAVYAMGEWFAGAKLAISAGARYERTELDYTGYEIVFGDEGDFAAKNPLRGSKSYGELLPMINVRYSATDNDNFRAAITRSLARPNYFQLAPYELVLEEDLEIERGNSNLDVTTAWNADLMYERYLPSVGFLSAGVFWKSLENYVYPFRYNEVRNGDEYEVLQPLNGDSAKLHGVEVAYQNRFRSPPALFDGLGMYANYTWTDSKADFPDRDSESTLPGQASRVGNVALTWERNAFTARIAANFYGKYISEVGEDAASDIYVDDHTQLDFSASYSLRSNLSINLELLNLTDEPFRRCIGSSDRPVQEEYYSWWGTLGVKWSL
ncbi:MAG: TonB-dependent receptor [Thermoanaerobaculia bacterium]